MKLFKNRVDIYISKANISGSKQAKILYALLAVIIVFTAVFLILLSQRYSSAAEFFGEGEVTVTEQSIANEENLPKIEGKKNFLIFETDDSSKIIHYIFLLQGDKDSLAYKTAALSPDMKIEKKSLSDIFEEGGGAALQTALIEYFGFEIDYYAQFEMGDFVEFASKLGTFVYSSPEKIHFSGGTSDDKYTIKISEGEQNINGKEVSNLLRYYSQERKNYAAENELILRAISELFNSENFEDCESLFRLFVKSCKTDITVRDFENGKNALLVFCTKNTDVTLYSEAPQYEGDAMSPQSIKSVTGYFSK